MTCLSNLAGTTYNVVLEVSARMGFVHPNVSPLTKIVFKMKSVPKAFAKGFAAQDINVEIIKSVSTGCVSKAA